MASQFNNLIKSKSIASITPQQILAAGQIIFLDASTSQDLKSINKSIPAYQHIHSPTYGQPIPLSGEVSSVEGSETLLAPGNNEIRRVLGIDITNAGAGAPIVANVTLGGVIVIAGAIVAPSETAVVSVPSNLYASKNLPLAISVSSGTAAELTTQVASILTTQ
jgi:hypothetical protein